MTTSPPDPRGKTSRRDFLGELGTLAALASVVPASIAQTGNSHAGACLLTPAATEGPSISTTPHCAATSATAAPARRCGCA
ncbi:twin-arginine translocation signal domain-containing protein [Cupriavidus basilensis]